MSKTKGAPTAVGRKDLLTVLEGNEAPMTPEDLFKASGHTQDSVDLFFAELRDLTTYPAKIEEQRLDENQVFLQVRK